MSEALKRARHEVAGRLEAAKDDFDAMNRRTAAQSNRDGERRAEWAARIEEDQATLDAIDAAIAAEARGATQIRICLGDTTVEANVRVEDAQRLLERQRSEKLRVATAEVMGNLVDGDEEARAETTNPPIDTSGMEPIDPSRLPELRIDLGEGHEARIWAKAKDLGRIVEMAHELGIGEFATGGIAGTDFEPGLVGERAGEAIASGKPTAGIVASYHPERTPHPCTIRLGDEFEVLTISDRDNLVRSLGKVVEIFADGGPKDSLYSVEIERAAGWRLDYEADDRDIKERHQRIGSLVRLDNLRHI